MVGLKAVQAIEIPVKSQLTPVFQRRKQYRQGRPILSPGQLGAYIEQDVHTGYCATLPYVPAVKNELATGFILGFITILID